MLPPTDVKVLKDRLVTAVKVLIHEGLIDAFGHASLRVPGTDHVLVPGHTHLTEKTIADIVPDDVVTIDLDGNTLEGEADPPGERFIYTGIYRARADVAGVVHVHPPMAIAFSAADRRILPIWTQGSVFTPEVPVLDYPAQIDTPALGEAVAHALGGCAALLLRSHGAVTVGRTLEEACVIAVNLERNAAMQWVASMLGTPRPIEPDYLHGDMMRGVSREEYVNAYWAYYVDRARRARR